ncbi:hypothetical protein AUJ14_05725 [Candidatus Micrarchaeota archaeon CG1_02_55_22]|nr:MAG: hypothetical protein AUJ14_05725 [Candidatus Micrarchaeota archaeon CG1_02_55_22]
MIFVDTGVFIALARVADEHHSRAVSLSHELEASGETLVFSEAILAEFASYVSRYHGPAAARDESVKLMESSALSLVVPTPAEIRGALDALKQYSFSSYADALSVTLMQGRGIRRIASFDSDFDRVKGLKRIH